jgi:hypothetical protein
MIVNGFSEKPLVRRVFPVLTNMRPFEKSESLRPGRAPASKSHVPPRLFGNTFFGQCQKGVPQPANSKSGTRGIPGRLNRRSLRSGSIFVVGPWAGGGKGFGFRSERRQPVAEKPEGFARKGGIPGFYGSNFAHEQPSARLMRRVVVRRMSI